MSGLMLSEINHFVAAEEVIRELNKFVQVYACQDGNVYISPLWDAVLRDNFAAAQLEADILADEDRREQAGEFDTEDTQVQDVLAEGRRILRGDDEDWEAMI